MKVILLQDVAKIGRRTTVVEVPDGYALNQLIPKGMAQAATPANLKRVEKLQAEVVASKEAGHAQFEAAKKALHAQVIEIVADSNEQEHLFKAVNAAEIVTAAQATGVNVNETMIAIGAPIKALGEHQVELVLGEHKAAFTIKVVKK